MNTSSKVIKFSHAMIVNGQNLSEARHASLKVETDRRGRDKLVRMELEIIRKINHESAVYDYVIDYDSRQDEKTVETEMSHDELDKFEEDWHSNWSPMLRTADKSDKIKYKVINYEPLSNHHQLMNQKESLSSYTGERSSSYSRSSHERRSSDGSKKKHKGKRRSHDRSEDSGSFSRQSSPERPSRSSHDIRSSDGSKKKHKGKRHSHDRSEDSGSFSPQSPPERPSRSSHDIRSSDSDGSKKKHKSKRHSRDSFNSSGSSSRQSHSTERHSGYRRHGRRDK